MFSDKAKSPLIVDQDEEFLSAILKDPHTISAPPIIARSGKEAQRILANPEALLSGIFLNPKIKLEKGEPDSISIIKFSKQHRMNMPIYLLSDASTSSGLDLHQLGVKKEIPKPLTYKEMLEFVAPHVISFKASESSQKGDADKIDSELQASDQDFVPIVAKDFVSGSTNNFSVYVRTGLGRYIKVLHHQETFDPGRLENYFKKGLQYLYLRKEEQEQYLKFSELISSSVLKNEQISVEIKASQTLNYGQETVKFLTTQGLSETRLYHAVNFVESLHGVASKMSEDNELIASLMKDLECYEHGVSISMLTALIAHANGIESNQAVQIVGISSLLHDIGLVGMPHNFEYRDINSMTKEELELYYQHPKKGAELMKQIPGTLTTVIQAIEHHHERRGDKAFDPSQNRPKAISRIAEMIGIADEYLNVIEKMKTDPSIKLKETMEKKIYRGFSNDTVDAFIAVFFPRKRSQ